MGGNGFEPSKRVQRSIQVLESLDIELKKKAAELKSDKSDLYELGASVILAILEAGYVPDELGYLLQSKDPELAERLADLARRAKQLKAEVV